MTLLTEWGQRLRSYVLMNCEPDYDGQSFTDYYYSRSSAQQTVLYEAAKTFFSDRLKGYGEVTELFKLEGS